MTPGAAQSGHLVVVVVVGDLLGRFGLCSQELGHKNSPCGDRCGRGHQKSLEEKQGSRPSAC